MAMTSVSPFRWILDFYFIRCISKGSRILPRTMTCVYIDFQKTDILYLRVVSQQLNIIQYQANHPNATTDLSPDQNARIAATNSEIGYIKILFIVDQFKDINRNIIAYSTIHIPTVVHSFALDLWTVEYGNITYLISHTTKHLHNDRTSSPDLHPNGDRRIPRVQRAAQSKPAQRRGSSHGEVQHHSRMRWGHRR